MDAPPDNSASAAPRAIVKPRTPSGTLELLPAEQAAFQHMLDVIRATYERFGFRPIETPVFEETNVLLTKSGGETEKQVYFVQSTGSLEQGHKPDLALRFDLTVPLARYVAEHERELAFPFRRYQMQRVYRGERAQKGRFREFYQCDIDIIGKDHLAPIHDAEMPAAIAQIFETLGVGDFTIHISNRKIMLGYLATLGVADDKHGAVLREIDKLDKIGRGKVGDALQQALGISGDVVKKILDLIEDTRGLGSAGGKAQVIARLRSIAAPAPMLAQGIDELAELAAALEALAVPDRRTSFNLAIVRGLDYYTGTVYETFLDAHPGLGSVCSGGRYENLAGLYTRSHLPGVGISIGATRLFDQLRELGVAGKAAPVTKVLVLQMAPDLVADQLRIATKLRAAGIATETYLEAHKLDKQLKFADKAGIPVVVMRGADEVKAGQVSVKILATREQKTLAEADLAPYIQSIGR